MTGDYGQDPVEHSFYPKSVNLQPEPGIEQRNDAFIRKDNRLVLAAVERLLVRLLDKRR